MSCRSAPSPDAPYWPGRRVLELADAVAWPAGWIALAMQLPQPAGIGPMVIALAVLSGVGRAHRAVWRAHRAVWRAHRAVWRNHRYHFTTWRWGRFVGCFLLISLVLRVAMPA